jgi:subtilisin family serine protease
MKRILAFLKNGLVLIAIVVVAAGVSVVLTLLGGEGGDGAAESPLATATAAATVDVSDKIEPELLELLELEEQQPGQGREQAAWNIPFDEEGRVSVIIGLDPNVIVVHPRKNLSTPVGQQEASQLILAYGADIADEISLGNLITAYVPLDQIRALAQEEAVTDIWLDRYIEDIEEPVAPTRTPSPEGLLQDDPNAHIRADLLWEQGYRGEGVKVAIVDSGLDVGHNAFLEVTKSAIDISDTERDGGWGQALCCGFGRWGFVLNHWFH